MISRNKDLIVAAAGIGLLALAFAATECGDQPRSGCAEQCELMHQLAGGVPGESRWVNGKCESPKVVVMVCDD